MLSVEFERELTDRAGSLVGFLRDAALETERAGRVSSDILDAVAEVGVFRMTAPKRYGGMEVSFDTQCDVLAKLAQGCPSTSWVATIYSAMSWLVGVFADEAQDEIHGSGDPRISGVFAPTGTAQPVSGGYLVSGEWAFATGCHGSKWTVLNAVQPTEDGIGLPMCVIVRTSELAVKDDWDAMGMAGTGSNTVVAQDTFVPHYRTLPLPDLIEARYPDRHNAANPYFNLPGATVLIVNSGGTPVGTAQGALDSFLGAAPGRPITYTTYADKAEAPITHLQAAEAALMIDSARAHVGMSTRVLDNVVSQPLSVESRVAARVHIGYATGLARQAVDLLFHGSGGSAVLGRSPIQRFQRDIQALANHAIMHGPTAVELYGRTLCGLAPNTVLF